MHVRRFCSKPVKTVSLRSGTETRRGIGSLEYVLLMAVIFSLVLIMMKQGIDLIQAVYELMAAWVAWPFL